MENLRDMALSRAAESKRTADAEIQKELIETERKRQAKEEKLARSLARIAEFLDLMHAENIPQVSLMKHRSILATGWVISEPYIDHTPIGDAGEPTTIEHYEEGTLLDSESGVSYRAYFEVDHETSIADVGSRRVSTLDADYYGDDHGQELLIRRASQIY